jgi:hypothetical protein
MDTKRTGMGRKIGGIHNAGSAMRLRAGALEPRRSLAQIRRVVKRSGSATLAAMNGQLTCHEYNDYMEWVASRE